MLDVPARALVPPVEETVLPLSLVPPAGAPAALVVPPGDEPTFEVPPEAAPASFALMMVVAE